jgi:beta-xylosidase
LYRKDLINKFILISVLVLTTGCKHISEKNFVTASETADSSTTEAIWNTDQGDGTYKNPVLFADYSDPDVIRVGDDYYMTASSFNCVPGLPILHSYDLVNWSLIGYALSSLKPAAVYDKPQHGCGVWAPSLRYHNDGFWIYFGDPDQGIFMVKAVSPEGPWSEPIMVEEGKGLIDPCPFWEEDKPESKAYLVHAFAGSRAGIKSILVVKRMNSEGTQTLDRGIMVFDGHTGQPTIEGPKLYKRNGYYYIFAPAGGVKEGWQLVLRSINIYGPYEVKEVLHQGNTNINGPHQGAWVETVSGESWFIHFQDCGPFGRVVHLEPLVWKNEWPFIGTDQNNDGIGEPVSIFRKPKTDKPYPVESLNISDEFNSNRPGLQWQWQANPKANWDFPSGNLGYLQLYAVTLPTDCINLTSAPNLLLQKIHGPEFTSTVKLSFHPNNDGEKTGLLIMGSDYAYIGLLRKQGKIRIIYSECLNAFGNATENISILDTLSDKTIYLRVSITDAAACKFGYSVNGNDFSDIPDSFIAQPGKWIGAKIGFFCNGKEITNNAGYVDIDWFRAEENISSKD